MNSGALLQSAARLAWSREPDAKIRYVAVSGGLDSVCLLEALARTRAPGADLRVLHVNHSLRGAESDGDEAFVKARAEGLGLPFLSHRLRWPTGTKPSQARCRDERRKFFGQVLAPGDLLYLAHHRDDQAETLLLRLLRGTGLRGLRGMSEVSGPLRRPFLALPRAAIAAAAGEWGLHWREDRSNTDLRYERNWLRAEILPRLEARRPGAAARIAAIATEAAALPDPTALTVFRAADGVRFVDGGRAATLSTSSLAGQFGLSRRHATGLADLLKKGRGNYQAEGLRFSLSRGILLAETRGSHFDDVLTLRTRADGTFSTQSALGVWNFSAEWAGRVGTAAGLRLGDSAKKQFQVAGVPVFFRAAFPFWHVRDAWRLLSLTAPACEPSALGHWWLNSSGFPGAARSDGSKE